jgi:prevent-host-death family protein
MYTVSTTEIQNNFGKYLKLAMEGKEIIILKNGKEVARLVSHEKSVSFLSDSLLGILKQDSENDDLAKERTKKYENID